MPKRGKKKQQAAPRVQLESPTRRLQIFRARGGRTALESLGGLGAGEPSTAPRDPRRAGFGDNDIKRMLEKPISTISHDG